MSVTRCSAAMVHLHFREGACRQDKAQCGLRDDACHGQLPVLAKAPMKSRLMSEMLLLL